MYLWRTTGNGLLTSSGCSARNRSSWRDSTAFAYNIHTGRNNGDYPSGRNILRGSVWRFNHINIDECARGDFIDHYLPLWAPDGDKRKNRACPGDRYCGDSGDDSADMFIANPLSKMTLKFGPSEFFALMTLAIVILTSISRGSMVKGLIMVTLGYLLNYIGIDPISGGQRFTFGTVHLTSGFRFSPKWQKKCIPDFLRVHQVFLFSLFFS